MRIQNKMPYIKNLKKDKFLFVLKEIQTLFEYNKVIEGELNFLITRILLATNPKRYSDYNKLVGVLECVKQEFYRRSIAKYEDKKIQENGDIYDLGLNDPTK